MHRSSGGSLLRVHCWLGRVSLSAAAARGCCWWERRCGSSSSFSWRWSSPCRWQHPVGSRCKLGLVFFWKGGRGKKKKSWQKKSNLWTTTTTLCSTKSLSGRQEEEEEEEEVDEVSNGMTTKMGAEIRSRRRLNDRVARSRCILLTKYHGCQVILHSTHPPPKKNLLSTVSSGMPGHSAFYQISLLITWSFVRVAWSHCILTTKATTVKSQYNESQYNNKSQYNDSFAAYQLFM